LKIKQDFIPFENTPLIGQVQCRLIIYYHNSIKTFDRPNFAGEQFFFEAGVFNSEDDLFKSENLQSTEEWSMF